MTAPPRTTEEWRELAAQMWCHSTTSHLTMEPALAEVFASMLMAVDADARIQERADLARVTAERDEARRAVDALSDTLAEQIARHEAALALEDVMLDAFFSYPIAVGRGAEINARLRAAFEASRAARDRREQACHEPGCTSGRDPRWFIHDASMGACVFPSCDAHGCAPGQPCSGCRARREQEGKNAG